MEPSEQSECGSEQTVIEPQERDAGVPGPWQRIAGKVVSKKVLVC